MANQRLPHVPEAVKGLIAIIAGAVLLIHTLGIIPRSLDMLIIIGALLLIIYGVMKADLYQKIMLKLNKGRNRS